MNQGYGVKGYIKMEKHPVVLFFCQIVLGQAIKPHGHFINGATVIDEND